MGRKNSTAKKGGAPRKAPDGLDRVLFVRTSQELLDKLEEVRLQRSKQNEGIVLSKADVARAILWEGIDRASKKE